MVEGTLKLEKESCCPSRPVDSFRFFFTENRPPNYFEYIRVFEYCADFRIVYSNIGMISEYGPVLK